MLESLKDSVESMELLESFCSSVLLWIASHSANVRNDGISGVVIATLCGIAGIIPFLSLRSPLGLWQSKK